MARSSGGPATTTWRKPHDWKQRETIKFCQPVERCPSRTVDKVSSAASLLQLQHIAGRALNRLNRLVLLILWWEGRWADPGEKRGPRKTERHGRKTHSKCLTSTRRIEKDAGLLPGESVTGKRRGRRLFPDDSRASASSIYKIAPVSAPLYGRLPLAEFRPLGPLEPTLELLPAFLGGGIAGKRVGDSSGQTARGRLNGMVL